MAIAYFPERNKLLQADLRTAPKAAFSPPAPAAAVRQWLLGHLSSGVDTNALIRDHVLHLIDLGINQKILAKRMGLSQAWFSRWVNQKHAGVIPVTALDGFAAYLGELFEAIQTAGTTAESAVLQLKRLERERAKR